MMMTTISCVGAPPCFSDPDMEMLALESNESDKEKQSLRKDAQSHDEQVTTCRKAEREAIKEAKEQEEKSSFWSDFAGTAKTVGVVAAGAAAIAATGGAGAPAVIIAAGAALKIGAEVGEKTGILDAKTAFAVDLVGDGAMLAGGIGGAFAAGSAAEGIGGAASATGSAAAGASTTATVVETAGHVVSAGAAVTEGVAMKVSRDHHASALDSKADGARAEQREDAAKDDRSTDIHRLDRATKQDNQRFQAVAGHVEQKNSAERAIIGRIRA